MGPDRPRFTLGVSQQVIMGILAHVTLEPALREWDDAPEAGEVWTWARILDVYLAFQPYQLWVPETLCGAADKDQHHKHRRVWRYPLAFWDWFSEVTVFSGWATFKFEVCSCFLAGMLFGVLATRWHSSTSSDLPTLFSLGEVQAQYTATQATPSPRPEVSQVSVTRFLLGQTRPAGICALQIRAGCRQYIYQKPHSSSGKCKLKNSGTFNRLNATNGGSRVTGTLVRAGRSVNCYSHFRKPLGSSY